MKKINALIINRQAYVTKNYVSKSISARINEGFNYLQEKQFLDFQIINEYELNTFSDLDIGKYDCFIFSRHNSKEAYEFALRLKAKNKVIIYDIDDFLEKTPQYISWGLDQNQKIYSREIISLSTYITVPTELAKEVLDNYYGFNALVIPTGINVEKYLSKKIEILDQKSSKVIFTNGDKIRLGKFKEGFIKTLSDFLSKSNVNIEIITDPNEEMNQFPNSKVLGNMDWFQHKHFLGSNHMLFGIIPLDGEEEQENLIFNKCKSQIKFIDYGATLIPGIYSRSPVYEKYIEHNVTGLLVKNSSDDWREGLLELYNNNELRKKLTLNALDKVNELYHVKKTSSIWLELIKKGIK